MALSAVWLTIGSNPSVSQQADLPSLTVSVSMPQQLEWAETVSASGWIRPWQEGVIASQISGLQIAEILVDMGAVVKKGDILATLSNDSVKANMRKQTAAVETAKASLSKARSDADRARRMSASGAMSEEKIVDYLANEQTATASLAAEEAALDGEKIKLEQTTIRAVDDGVITSRSAELGAVVSTGTEMFRMNRQQRTEWQAEVSPQDLTRISEGMTAQINGISETVVRGTVRLIAPSIETDTGRATVYIALPKDARPRSGTYVSGTIELRTSQALAIQDTALVYRDGIAYVFVADNQDRARRFRVATGRRNGDKVEILSGLSADARIVTSGGTFLSDGDLVRIEAAVR
nr:efflux RND transporter periplasmic adaptor subunit [Rhizobium cellulosilyticum]